MKNKVKAIIQTGNSVIRMLMPYMSFLAVILCVINFIYMMKIESDIEDVHHSVNNISMDYDNSDVIRAVEDAESNIIGSVEDAESNIKRNFIIWGN